MSWYYPVTSNKTIQCELIGCLTGTQTTTQNIFPFPAVNGQFNPLGLDIIKDGNNIVVNPATVNPVTTPAFLINESSKYTGLIVTFEIEETVRAALPAAIVIHLGICIDSTWREIGHIDIQAAAVTVYKMNTVACAIPRYWYNTTDNKMQFTLGINSNLGSAISGVGLQRIFINASPSY